MKIHLLIFISPIIIVLLLLASRSDDPFAKNTVDLQVWNGPVTPFGDGTVCKKGKCDPAFFNQVVTLYKLKPVVQRLPPGCSVWARGDPNWWTPPRDYGICFYSLERKHRVLAAYKDGYIYFESSFY
jgi:hypothetical protein